MARNEMRIEVWPIKKLTPHPKNYRKHPQEQIDVLRASIRNHGQQRTVVITPDGMILAGHGFVIAARQEGWEDVTCTVYTGNNPDAFLVMDNQSNTLAEDDIDALDALLTEIAKIDGTLEAAGFDDSIISSLLADVAHVGQAKDEEDEQDDEEDDAESDTFGAEENDVATDETPTRKVLTPQDVPDMLFPTDNDFDIPLLDIRLQAEAVTNPVTKWGTVARHSIVMPGTWHFYTDDYKFDGLWKDPTSVVNSQCINAAEINFSTHESEARAIVLYNIYQKRWIARFWQHHGVRLFVDMNVETQFLDLNLIGVPKGWRAYITRGYSNHDDELEKLMQRYECACEHAGTDDILFWVYGGGNAVRDVAAQHNWIWVSEHLSSVAEKKKRYGK